MIAGKKGIVIAGKKGIVIAGKKGLSRKWERKVLICTSTRVICSQIQNVVFRVNK